MLIGILRFLLVILLVNWLFICIWRLVMCLIQAAVLVLRCGYAAVFMVRRGSHFLRVLLEGTVSVVSLVWLRVVLAILFILMLVLRVLNVQIIAEMLERLITWLVDISFRDFVRDCVAIIFVEVFWLLIGVLSCWLIGVLDLRVLSWGIYISALNIGQFSWELIFVRVVSDLSWLILIGTLNIGQFSWEVIFVLASSEFSWFVG